MFAWNYRIIYHNTDPHPYYGLHHVHYGADGSVENWTETPDIVGDTAEEIRVALLTMLNDIQRLTPLLESELLT